MTRPPHSLVILQGTSRVRCRIPETSALGIWQAKASTQLFWIHQKSEHDLVVSLLQNNPILGGWTCSRSQQGDLSNSEVLCLWKFKQVGVLNYDSLFAVAQNFVPFEVLWHPRCVVGFVQIFVGWSKKAKIENLKKRLYVISIYILIYMSINYAYIYYNI